ncbi:MAG TPA: acylneuraminate cytidylyltransferase family protein [Sporosarcina psychrophila]|uniref:Acylneuraminate cytidylyltransferase family protein n=1 Tax=Sporosarcina psychrophila TaxID=1476 RepID=A0A921KEV9_SPOPS|nr:acylneuraminate cytidylyltransferase family protein [Sporosarcina psychrophila]
MINGKKVLAIIPARGGSKGIVRKNVRQLAGKPLIAWTIEEAKKSKYIDRLIVSSEDEEIIGTAIACGCDVPFVRPDELALDSTPGIDPVLHALEEIQGYDYVVLLQPTSPLRLVEDIEGCIENLMETGSPACVSVTEPDSSPYWMYTVNAKGTMQPLIKQDELVTRRQDLPIVYGLNGAVYVAQTEWLQKSQSFLTKETTVFVMPKSRSYDIDTEEDFLWCEWMLRK